MNKMESFRITNMCATFNLSSKLNIEVFKEENHSFISELNYNPKSFNALFCKHVLGSPTFLLFSTGSVVIVGATSRDQLFDASEDLMRDLQHYSPEFGDFIDYRITNVCCSSEVPFSIDLIRMCQSENGHCSYEQEIIPNMIYHFEGIKFTICHSGKFYAPGFKSEDEARDKFRRVSEILQQYEKHDASC